MQQGNVEQHTCMVVLADNKLSRHALETAQIRLFQRALYLEAMYYIVHFLTFIVLLQLQLQ